MWLKLEPGKTEPIQYEEVYSQDKDFYQNILKIDKVIYQGLYDCGIEQNRISFISVEPRRANGRIWEYSSMRVRVSDYQQMKAIEDAIEDAMRGNNIRISFVKKRISKKKLVYNFFADGYRTHDLILFYDGKVERKREEQLIPRVAIIIDDLGYDMGIARKFLDLDMPLDVSVLPYAPYSKKIAREVTMTDKELMLHLPMEPKGYPGIIPGKGALFTSMDDEELKHIICCDLEQIKGIKGVNNHMGSRFTEDKHGMLLLLNEIKKRGLFFVDSITTPDSVGYKLAKMEGIKTIKRDVFLDPHRQYGLIRSQMERLLGIARNKKVAVGIGHPYPETLEVIKEFKDRLLNDAVIVHISDLMN